jgi:hypothetical protein
MVPVRNNKERGTGLHTARLVVGYFGLGLNVVMRYYAPTRSMRRSTGIKGVASLILVHKEICEYSPTVEKLIKTSIWRVHV